MIDKEDEIIHGDLTLSSDQKVVSDNVRMVTLNFMSRCQPLFVMHGHGTSL